ncbi:MAG TPA: hypothetical protein V6D26_09150 [Stenomitos sp.]
MGLGWHVSIKNETSNKITVSHVEHDNWYPNDLGHTFDIESAQEVTKYTEIKSSGFSPAQRSYLIIQLSSSGKRDTLIQLKGTIGDLSPDFDPSVKGDGFEIGIKMGDLKYSDLDAQRKAQVEMKITFMDRS